MQPITQEQVMQAVIDWHTAIKGEIIIQQMIKDVARTSLRSQDPDYQADVIKQINESIGKSGEISDKLYFLVDRYVESQPAEATDDTPADPPAVKVGQWMEVSSSNIKALRYDPTIHELGVEFNTGSIYIYAGVSQNLYEQLMGASSKGKFFQQYIKGIYPFQKVEWRRNDDGGDTRPETQAHAG